ncbi:flavodoxin [Spirochaetia bacterium]|nr:flavodoxin [Spirochaetia bacterium]
MKKIAVLAILVFSVMTVIHLNAQSQTGRGKILIAYFTLPETDGVDTVSGASRVVVDGKVSGNVEFVANIIHKAVGGDLFVIRTARTYPGEHRPLLEAAQNEQKANARPPLAAHISSPQNYDTIFLGYPIWWYDLPMPIYSFLDEYNLAGKTIIPFTVHGGSRFSGTVEKITQLEPGAVVSKEGIAISRNDAARSERDVTAWLRRLGMVR